MLCKAPLFLLLLTLVCIHESHGKWVRKFFGKFEDVFPGLIISEISTCTIGQSVTGTRSVTLKFKERSALNCAKRCYKKKLQPGRTDPEPDIAGLNWNKSTRSCICAITTGELTTSRGPANVVSCIYKIIGEWSNWVATECSATCGKGIIEFSRTCIGGNCDDIATKQPQECQIQECEESTIPLDITLSFDMDFSNELKDSTSDAYKDTAAKFTAGFKEMLTSTSGKIADDAQLDWQFSKGSVVGIARDVPISGVESAEAAQQQLASVDTSAIPGLESFSVANNVQGMIEKKGEEDEYPNWTHEKCTFPFEYDGKLYSGCTKTGSDNDVPWCSHDAVYAGGWDSCKEQVPFFVSEIEYTRKDAVSYCFEKDAELVKFETIEKYDAVLDWVWGYWITENYEWSSESFWTNLILDEETKKALLPNGQVAYEHWYPGYPKSLFHGIGILQSVKRDRTATEFGMWNADINMKYYAVCENNLREHHQIKETVKPCFEETVGYCLDENSNDQNNGQKQMDPEIKSKEACLKACANVEGATACEIYNDGVGCAAHTLTVSKGSGSGNAEFGCLKFKPCG